MKTSLSWIEPNKLQQLFAHAGCATRVPTPPVQPPPSPIPSAPVLSSSVSSTISLRPTQDSHPLSFSDFPQVEVSNDHLSQPSLPSSPTGALQLLRPPPFPEESRKGPLEVVLGNYLDWALTWKEGRGGYIANHEGLPIVNNNIPDSMIPMGSYLTSQLNSFREQFIEPDIVFPMIDQIIFQMDAEGYLTMTWLQTGQGLVTLGLWLGEILTPHEFDALCDPLRSILE